MQKIVFATGGSGGHILPAIEFSKSIKAQAYFIGVGLSQNSMMEGIPGCIDIQGASLSFSPSLKTIKGIAKNLRGIIQSIFFLKKNQIDCVIGFGSYHSFPTLAAAAICRIPIIIYEPNAIFGRVNKLFYPLAKQVLTYLPADIKKTIALSFVSPQNNPSKEEALNYFTLNVSFPTLLVFGGSQGSSVINAQMGEIAPNLPYQIIHLIGKHDSSVPIEKQYQGKKFPYVIRAFEKRMDLAYKAADWVVSRAGASTIKELIEWEKPAIIIPYPFAMDDHQRKNGEFFCDIVKGGILLLQENLTPQVLVDAIKTLQTNQELFKNNILQFKQRHNGKHFAQVLMQLLERE